MCNSSSYSSFYSVRLSISQSCMTRSTVTRQHFLMIKCFVTLMIQDHSLQVGEPFTVLFLVCWCASIRNRKVWLKHMLVVLQYSKRIICMIQVSVTLTSHVSRKVPLTLRLLRPEVFSLLGWTGMWCFVLFMRKLTHEYCFTFNQQLQLFLNQY